MPDTGTNTAQTATVSFGSTVAASLAASLGTAGVAAITAAVGALGSYVWSAVTRKTPHLTWAEAAQNATTIEKNIVAPVLKKLKNLSLYENVSQICLRASAYIDKRADGTTWINEAKSASQFAQDRLREFNTGRISGESAVLSTIDSLLIYIGVNYDARRPQEFCDEVQIALENVLGITFKIDPTFSKIEISTDSGSAYNTISDFLGNLFGSNNTNTNNYQSAGGTGYGNIFLALIFFGGIVWYAAKKT